MKTIMVIKRDGNYFLESGEPIFILRAQDEIAHSTALYWAAIAESRSCSKDTVESARKHAESMSRWPTKKLPDINLLD